MNGIHPHAARKGSYSLKAIIHDVERREGRNFSGPEMMPAHPEPRAPLRPISSKGSYSLAKIIQEVSEREGCPIPAAGPEVSVRHREGLRYPRTTRQLTLDGGRVAPIVTPLDKFDLKGAGRGPKDPATPPRIASSNPSAVLSLLPQMPGLPDEAFLLLYLDASREFERRFGAPGWYDRVLALAARGR